MLFLKQMPIIIPDNKESYLQFIKPIPIKLERFTDNSLKCKIPNTANISYDFHIIWCYEDDSELFALISLVDELRYRFRDKKIYLKLPYIPNARQDRRVSGLLFTLKSFANIINMLKFERVYVYDAHSDVSTALIDNCVETYENWDFESEYDAVLYPDAGAAKRYYNPKVKVKLVANKHRNEAGEIQDYSLGTIPSNVKRVLIKDDICATGGTFTFAVKELKKQGVEHIDLLVSHCENTVAKGELLSLVDNLFTTDSICSLEHPKVHFIKKFKEN